MPSGYSLTGVNVQEEGASVGFASTLNFTGAGVTATAVGGTVTVNIPGGGAPGPQPSANDLRFPAIAGEDVTAGELMRMDDSGLNPGTVLRACAINSESVAIGVTASSSAAGASVPVVHNGTVSVLFQAPLAVADIGRTVYVSPTMSGRATLTPPSTSGQSVVKVGTLVSTSAGSSTGNVILALILVARLL